MYLCYGMLQKQKKKKTLLKQLRCGCEISSEEEEEEEGISFLLICNWAGLILSTWYSIVDTYDLFFCRLGLGGSYFQHYLTAIFVLFLLFGIDHIWHSLVLNKLCTSAGVWVPGVQIWSGSTPVLDLVLIQLGPCWPQRSPNF